MATKPPTATMPPPGPTTTAQGQNINDTAFGWFTVREAATYLNARMGLLQKWDNVRPPDPGSYGFDTYVGSLNYMTRAYESVVGGEPIVQHEVLAKAAHEGWVQTYKFWRDNKPWEQEGFRGPFRPLGDERRERCAATAYEDLTPEEQEKDLILARAVCDRVAVVTDHRRMMIMQGLVVNTETEDHPDWWFSLLNDATLLGHDCINVSEPGTAQCFVGNPAVRALGVTQISQPVVGFDVIVQAVKKWSGQDITPTWWIHWGLE